MTRKRKGGLETSQMIGEKVALRFGYELVGASMDKEPPGVYLRFFLDKPGGITLDDCERFHREVQPMLEKIDYDFLEVCSPGLDRPIKTDWDARKAMGEMVEIRLYKPLDGRKLYTGIFKSLNEAGYTIETEQGEVTFPQKTVALARRVIDLSILDDETIIEQEVGYEQP
ncbi:MAG: ribosome maturation factor RimP [Christensenellales bacterium]|jgi:ribosome maturation factor RimP